MPSEEQPARMAPLTGGPLRRGRIRRGGWELRSTIRKSWRPSVPYQTLTRPTSGARCSEPPRPAAISCATRPAREGPFPGHGPTARLSL